MTWPSHWLLRGGRWPIWYWRLMRHQMAYTDYWRTCYHDRDCREMDRLRRTDLYAGLQPADHRRRLTDYEIMGRDGPPPLILSEHPGQRT